MMSVMLSIRPEWIDKILSGEKTIEVRKTRPKVGTPFKCFIYCTKPKFEHEDFFVTDAGTAKIRAFHGGGKVVAEFVCDQIFPLAFYVSDIGSITQAIRVTGTAMTDKEIMEYLGNGVKGYGWHISDLKVYDEPKELWQFVQKCRHKGDCNTCQYFDRPNFECHRGQFKRPPQSWAYVEDNILEGMIR